MNLYRYILVLMCVIMLSSCNSQVNSNEEHTPESTTAESENIQGEASKEASEETNESTKNEVDTTQPYAFLEYNLIAHAGGEINGDIATNSIDAIEYSYNQGFRIIEVDLTLTSDGKLVCNHSWELWDEVPTYEEFMSTPIQGENGVYSPTDVDMLMQFMYEHPDVYIVTDTKSFEYTDEQAISQFQQIYDAAVKYDEEILDRIIIQIYDQNTFKQMQTVYDFQNVIYTLYNSPDSNEEAIYFCEQNDIKVITTYQERIDEQFIKDCNRADITLFTHTVNDIELLHQYQEMGIYGFYTDTIKPADLE